MKTEEFAFFNQQLAAMLRDGIPLEGALKRLCSEMQQGKLRNELQALETDLACGTPLAAALTPRALPELYKRMILVGVKGNDLPGALTMVADFFESQNQVWLRLKSMMTYPIIVLFVAFFISLVISGAWGFAIGPAFQDIYAGMGVPMPGATLFAFQTLRVIWIFPVAICLLFLIVAGFIFVPALRAKIIWRLPAFKEATVARIASSIHLLLKNGVALPEAISLTEQLETSRVAADDLGRWRTKVASGVVKFSEVAAQNRLIPPMFVWLVAGAGENLTEGFQRAAEIYHARAIYRTEVALYSVLPLASIVLGVVVLSQAFLVLSMFLPMIAMISNLSGNGS